MGRRQRTRALLRLLWLAVCRLIGLEVVRLRAVRAASTGPIVVLARATGAPAALVAVEGDDFRWPSTWPRPIATARPDFPLALALVSARRTR